VTGVDDPGATGPRPDPATSRRRSSLPEVLTPEQTALREEILAGRTSDTSSFQLTDAQGALTGPFGPMLLSPGVGSAVQGVGRELRFQGHLTADVREIVTLYVAHHRSSDFEWYAHEPLALKAGISAAAVAEIRAGRLPDDLSPPAAIALAVAARVVARDLTDDALFEDARSVLGASGMFEVVVLCGYYNLLADLLDFFQIGAPSPGDP
jgi:hypothetical protein